jgi:hypothetical protein
MSEGRDLLQQRIDEERQYAREHFEVQYRAAGYLLTANAAGLVGCMTLLKDYATVPQLKGIGVFIGLFGLGFISEVIGFQAITVHRKATLDPFLRERVKDPMDFGIWAFAFNALSCLLLCAAVALMINRFIWL